jgi:hypothetical protein
MYKHLTLTMALLTPMAAHASVEDELRTMREQIVQLENRVQQTELTTQTAPRTATSEGAFNPAISLILSGTYGSLQQNPDLPATGFALLPNDHGYSRSLSLKESELGISANIDPQFRGVATFAITPEGSISAENAYVQSSALGNGFNLKMGRFFSGLGYLNEQHAHAWDFVDQPLVYRTFWDNQLSDDGLQLKWLANTDTFIELGTELTRGRGYPGSDRKDSNGAGAEVIYLHIGDDIGVSQSWRAGLSAHQTRRASASIDAFSVKNSFSGDSLSTGFDFVWKYAPNGNSSVSNLKLQGEYFQRKENGLLTYDTATTNTTGSYSVLQSGWYLQSVYQFMPHWRTGLRYDQLNSGNADVGIAIAANIPGSYNYTPTRTTLMLDYSPSEFSRLRLQLAQDQSRQGLSDNQVFLQYLMSLGAHGAHSF